MPTNMAVLSWRTGSIFSCCKGLWDVFLPKPITTKHQSVFWLVSQSRRMSAICVGSCRWISLAAACADPVVLLMKTYLHSTFVNSKCRKLFFFVNCRVSVCRCLITMPWRWWSAGSRTHWACLILLARRTTTVSVLSAIHRPTSSLSAFQSFRHRRMKTSRRR